MGKVQQVHCTGGTAQDNEINEHTVAILPPKSTGV